MKKILITAFIGLGLFALPHSASAGCNHGGGSQRTEHYERDQVRDGSNFGLSAQVRENNPETIVSSSPEKESYRDELMRKRNQQR
ncbi:MAG: hypothetical protein V4691_09010 [Pseudomonadota bacterium]